MSLIKVTMDEFHDVPDTKVAKWCWIEVHRHGDSVTVVYHSSSKETGVDLPLEYDHFTEKS